MDNLNNVGQNFVKSVGALIMTGLFCIVGGGIGIAGAYLMMLKLDGGDNSWLLTFSPSIAIFSLLSFVCWVIMTILMANSGNCCMGMTMGLAIAGVVALITIEPTIWLANYLDGDVTDIAGFTWPLWAGGIGAGLMVLLYPCTGLKENQTLANARFTLFHTIVNGSCMLSFVILLTNKLEDDTSTSYMDIWIPFLVMTIWNAVKDFADKFDKMQMEDCSFSSVFGTTGIGTITMGLLFQLTLSVYSAIFIPLYLDGTITEGWKVVIPLYI